jgi:hypothetical protein
MRITVLAILSIGACNAFAATPVNQTGFESPFSIGNMNTQQSWLSELVTPANDFKIQSTRVRTGTKALGFDLKSTTGVGASTTYRITKEEATSDMYVASVWLYMATDTRSGAVNRGEFGIEILGDEFELFPGFEIYNLGGGIFVTADGKVFVDGAERRTSTIVNSYRDGWMRMEFITKMGNQTGFLRGNIDGVDAGINLTARISNLYAVDLYASNLISGSGQRGTNQGFFDDFSVVRYGSGEQVLAGKTTLLNNINEAYPGPKNEKSVKVTLAPINGGAPIEQTGIMDADGYFTVDFAGAASSTANYEVLVKPRGFLQTRVPGTMKLSEVFQRVNPTIHINGDINDDNAVDLLDYFDLSDSYNLALGDNGFNDAADLNGDLSVDLLDYFILSDSYNLFGDEPTGL